MERKTDDFFLTMSKRTPTTSLPVVARTANAGVEAQAASSSAVNDPGAAAAAAASAYYNPISRYQEYVEVPGLTLFDIHRQPRCEIYNPDIRCRIQLKVLGSEFHCPICLGYIRNTRIVKECLHRFCHDCIEKCLRVGKKQCPQCRIHIPSRRSFRPDTNFDQLIQSIYGDIEQLEKFEEEEIAKQNKKNMNNVLNSDSRKRGMLYQAEQRKRSRGAIHGSMMGEQQQSRTTDNSNNNNSSNAAAAATRGNSSIIGGRKDDETKIELILRRHPHEIKVNSLRKEYIRTTNEITVVTLKKYLSKKLNYTPHEHFQVREIIMKCSIILYCNRIYSQLYPLSLPFPYIDVDIGNHEK